MRPSLLILLTVASCHHGSPPSLSAAPGATTVAEDERALRERMAGWWPALVSADTAYFDSILAQEFVQHRTRLNHPTLDRASFVDGVLHWPACGPRLTYQVQIANYSVLGAYGLATQTVTVTWGTPIDFQRESQNTTLFVKRAGKWWALEHWDFGRPTPQEEREPPRSFATPIDGDTSFHEAEPPHHPPAFCPRFTPKPVEVATHPAPLPPPLRSPGPTIRLRAIDVTTDRPLILRTALVEFPKVGSVLHSHDAHPDSAGLIELTDVQTREASLYCGAKIFGHYLLTLNRSEMSRALAGDTIVVRIDGSRCDQRPITTAVGHGVGHYRGGFESSGLRLCGDTTRTIWVCFSPHVMMPNGFKWPRPADRRDPAYLVRFVGTLTGPGHYGQWGIADYLLTVDSIAFARRPKPGDCPRHSRHAPH